MIFFPSEIDRLLLFIKKQFERSRAIKIETLTESKSLNQNRYAWLIFTHIAFETGSDKNYIYHLFLKRFPTFQEGKNLAGEIELVPISMSGFTKEQMSVFIDSVATEARSEGYDIPDPEDKKAREMYDFYKSKGLL